MSVPLRKRRLALKKNPAKRGHPVAGLVQHSAGLHGVVAAQLADYRTWSSDDSKSGTGTAFVCDDHHKRVYFTAAFVLVGQPTFEGDVRYEAALVHDTVRQRQRSALADAV